MIELNHSVCVAENLIDCEWEEKHQKKQNQEVHARRGEHNRCSRQKMPEHAELRRATRQQHDRNRRGHLQYLHSSIRTEQQFTMLS